MTIDKSKTNERILIDIGSTVIKYFRLNLEGKVLDRGYFDRNYDLLVNKQVIDILKNRIEWTSGCDFLRICSSANGGLSIGVLGYTERFSTAWAVKAAFNSGGNVQWATDLAGVNNTNMTMVDVFVLTGGFDDGPIEKQMRWLRHASNLPVKYETVVFAGNRKLTEAVQSLWPCVLITDNVIGEDMSWQGEALSHVLSKAYLNDLVLNKGIFGLQQISEVPIFPTPAVVHEAYKVILNGNSSIRYPTPFVMLDIGGATTDIFYGGELVIDNNGSDAIPSSNRHVFSHLGIFASRPQLIAHLSINPRLGDFLRALDLESSEQRYLALREGDSAWTTPEFLAEACCFLALNECLSGIHKGHKINLNRVAAIVITGGASQICNVSRIKRILKIFDVENIEIFIDENYEIWIEGMMKLDTLQVEKHK